MSRSRNNRSQKIGNGFLKKYGNKKYRAKVKQSIIQNKEVIPIVKEASNPWDWD